MTRIVVVAHHTRTTQAKALAETVGAAHITIDPGYYGCENNHHRALRWHTKQKHQPGEMCVILEDDAQPVPGFRQQLHQALALAPAPIVSLYLGTGHPPQHQDAITNTLNHAGDANWIISNRLLHCVGYVIRAHHLPSLLAHRSPLPIDQHITDWARKHHHHIAYTNPSLIDHADGPPINNHYDHQPRQPRHAHHTGTRNQWTTTTVAMQPS